MDASSNVYGLEYMCRHSDFDQVEEGDTGGRANVVDVPTAASSPQIPAELATPQADGPRVAPYGSMSRWGMHYLVTIVTNTDADCAWQVVFQAPEEDWEAEWSSWGSTVMDHAVVDWQPPIDV